MALAERRLNLPHKLFNVPTSQGVFVDKTSIEVVYSGEGVTFVVNEAWQRVKCIRPVPADNVNYVAGIESFEDRLNWKPVSANYLNLKRLSRNFICEFRWLSPMCCFRESLDLESVSGMEMKTFCTADLYRPGQCR